MYIHIEQISEGDPLAAGIMATVRIDSQHEIAAPGIPATSERQPEYDRRIQARAVVSPGRYEI